MVLQQNPGLKDLIIRVPDQVTTYVRGSPELSVLFEGVDIHALSAKLRAQENTGTNLDSEAMPIVPQPPASPTSLGPQEIPPQEQTPAIQHPQQSQPASLSPTPKPVIPAHALPAEPVTVSETADVPDASKLDDQQLLNFLNEKPQLKELLLSDPEQLEEMKVTNPRIATFFKTLSPAAIAARARNLGLAAEAVDFDALAKHLTE